MKRLLLMPLFYLYFMSNTLYVQDSPEDIALKFFDIYEKEDSDKYPRHIFFNYVFRCFTSTKC